MKSYEQNKRGLSYAYHIRIVESDGITTKPLLIYCYHLNLNYIVIMNNILDNLFYIYKVGRSYKATFIINVKERQPEIKLKDINEYLKTGCKTD